MILQSITYLEMTGTIINVIIQWIVILVNTCEYNIYVHHKRRCEYVDEVSDIKTAHHDKYARKKQTSMNFIVLLFTFITVANSPLSNVPESSESNKLNISFTYFLLAGCMCVLYM